jgi:hypothetical protein
VGELISRPEDREYVAETIRKIRITSKTSIIATKLISGSSEYHLLRKLTVAPLSAINSQRGWLGSVLYPTST